MKHFKRQPFERLIVGGPREVVADFESQAARLPGRAARRPHRRGRGAPRRPTRCSTTTAAAASRSSRRSARPRRWSASARAAAAAQRASRRCCAALNERRVERLLLDERFAAPGTTCPECGWLGPGGERTCPVDGTRARAARRPHRGRDRAGAPAVGGDPGRAPPAGGAGQERAGGVGGPAAVLARTKPEMVLEATSLDRMAGAAIEATELVREFKKGPRAVDGIDLRVEPGEVYGFLGPNGAGKSTTVHMLTTLLPPTSGTRAGGGPRRRQGGRPRCAPPSARRSRRRRSTPS